MSENQKQEIMLHFKKFYNALPLISKQRLKAIADKELNIVTPQMDKSFMQGFRKFSSDRD